MIIGQFSSMSAWPLLRLDGAIIVFARLLLRLDRVIIIGLFSSVSVWPLAW